MTRSASAVGVIPSGVSLVLEDWEAGGNLPGKFFFFLRGLLLFLFVVCREVFQAEYQVDAFAK